MMYDNIKIKIVPFVMVKFSKEKNKSRIKRTEKNSHSRLTVVRTKTNIRFGNLSIVGDSNAYNLSAIIQYSVQLTPLIRDISFLNCYVI